MWIMNFSVGQELSIKLVGGVCATMVSITAIHGTVIRETEKAVLIELHNARPFVKGQPLTIWLPKSAIVASKPLTGHVLDYFTKNNMLKDRMSEIAKWFKFDAQQLRILNRIDADIISVAT